MAHRSSESRDDRGTAMRRIRLGLWQRLGRRGCALLFFGGLDAVYAYSLLVPPETAKRAGSLRFVEGVAPLWVWALAWGIPGAFCLIQAWMRNDRLAFALAIAVKIVWGAMFILAGVMGAIERAYVGAAVWLALAGFVAIISTWPEPVPGAQVSRRQ